MKKNLLVLIIISFIGLTAFAPGSKPSKFTSTQGHFSIMFPGNPEQSSDDHTAENGTKYKIYFATYAPDNDNVYMIGWTDMAGWFPKDKTMKQMLEDSRDGAVSNMKANKVNTITTNLGENPYIEFTFEAESFMGKDRIYVLNNFQYSIITIFGNKKSLPAGADEFIRSFKILQ